MNGARGEGANLSDRVRANIHLLMEARGYTYSDLGWPRNYVGDVIHGRRGLSLTRLAEFADALGVDPVDLCRPVGGRQKDGLSLNPTLRDAEQNPKL